MDNSEVIYRLFLFVGFPRQIYFDIKIDYYNDDKREVK
jgi:hypothetical protein